MGGKSVKIGIARKIQLRSFFIEISCRPGGALSSKNRCCEPYEAAQLKRIAVREVLHYILPLGFLVARSEEGNPEAASKNGRFVRINHSLLVSAELTAATKKHVLLKVHRACFECSVGLGLSHFYREARLVAIAVGQFSFVISSHSHMTV